MTGFTVCHTAKLAVRSLLCLLLLATPAVAAPLTMDNIDYWVGTGSNRAALVIDWNDEKSNASIAWGYRWDGVSSGYQMLTAVIAADQRLFAHVGPQGSFGVPVYGAGYDLDNDGIFGTSPALAFNSGGLSSGTYHDGRAPTDAGDRWKEGWLSDGFWGYYTSVPGSTPTWGFAEAGNTDRMLLNGSWDGLSYAPGFADSVPSDAVSAQVPEPASAALAAGVLGFLLGRRRRRTAVAGVAVLVGAGVASSPAHAAYTYDPNDFAVEVVSSSGSFGAAPYNDPQAVIGRPTLKFNSAFTSSSDIRRAKLIEGVFNVGPSGEKLLTTLTTGSQITVRMGRPVTNDALNPFGIDFIVFGNAFYSGSNPSDATNLNNVTVGSTFGENTKVSVSPDGVNWYRYDNGPYADTIFPTNSYLWDSNAEAWTNSESDPTRPVNPDFASQTAGKSAAFVLDNYYAGSAGGTGFDLAASGFSSIQFIRVEGLEDFAGGEIDAFADVRPVPEPTAIATLGLVAAGLLSRRRRVR